jgi:hypothetical protein
MAEAGTPSRLKVAVHWTLSCGVFASGSLMVVGLAIALLGNQTRPEGMPAGVFELFRTAVAGNATSIIDLSLLLLMLTPPVRVAVLAVGWAWSGHRRFAFAALAVLAILGLSMVLGVA